MPGNFPVTIPRHPSDSRPLTPDMASFLAARAERVTDALTALRDVVAGWKRWCREKDVAVVRVRVDEAVKAYGCHVTFLGNGRQVVVGLRMRPDLPLLALPPGLESEDIAALHMLAGEVVRQRTVEGFTGVRDDRYRAHELDHAAAEYLHHAASPEKERAKFPPGDPGDMWPWDAGWWKPATPFADCLKGGALSVVALSRRLRAGEGGRS